jgi:hypothetical protein
MMVQKKDRFLITGDLDATKWCNKVFALTEKAFDLAEEDKEAGWLIWIDADSLCQEKIST